jgi:hypothetical protein
MAGPRRRFGCRSSASGAIDPSPAQNVRVQETEGAAGQTHATADPPSRDVEPVRHSALTDLVKSLARASAREHMADPAPLPFPADSPAHDEDTQADRPETVRLLTLAAVAELLGCSPRGFAAESRQRAPRLLCLKTVPGWPPRILRSPFVTEPLRCASKASPST